MLRPLNEFGWFMPSAFKDVCVGEVKDIPAFLERIATDTATRTAQEIDQLRTR